MTPTKQSVYSNKRSSLIPVSTRLTLGTLIRDPSQQCQLLESGQKVDQSAPNLTMVVLLVTPTTRLLLNILFIFNLLCFKSYFAQPGCFNRSSSLAHPESVSRLDGKLL